MWCSAGADEDVGIAVVLRVALRVGVTRHEVAGLRGEDDEAPVRRECRLAAALVALPSVRPDADPLGRARLAVADENVAPAGFAGGAVGVARDQVGGERLEGDEAPVRRDRHTGVAAGAFTLEPVGPETDALHRGELLVADEDVRA